MSQTLVIEVPDRVYEPLSRYANDAGKTPEEWVAQWVEQWVETGVRQIAEDPLEKFIGAFPSGNSNRDWVDRHDEYIAAHLEAEMQGQES